MASRNNQSRSTANNMRRNSQPARSTHSGRIASKQAAQRFSQKRYNHNGSSYANGAQSGGFRAAYSADSQRAGASKAYPQQSTLGGSGGQYSRSNPQYSKGFKRQPRKAVRIVFGSLCVILLAAIGAGTAYAFYMNSITEELTGTKTEEEKQAITDTLVPVKSFTDPFYMVLIGSDKREDDEEMGARSDTNILVRIDPEKGVVTMVSIPRDTRVDIDGYGTNKFNAVYNYGGVSSTVREASQLCGVDIAHYAEVDFNKLIQLVDVVGGVEVDVPELIDDPDAGNVVIQPGLQTLNGEAALVFARCRSYADGDFTRMANQRLLIEALVKKILDLPVTNLPGVIQQAAKCVSTDFTANDLLSLATQFREMGKITIYSAMIPSTTADIGGISYVISNVAGLAEMMQLVEAGEDPSSLKNTVSDYGYIPSENGSSGGGAGYSDSYNVPAPMNEDPLYQGDPGDDYIGINNGNANDAIDPNGANGNSNNGVDSQGEAA